MKKFLILQMRPEDDVAESELQSILRLGGLKRSQVDRIRVEQDDLNGIQLDNYCAIVAGGSPFDVSLERRRKTAAQLRVEEFFNKLFDEVVEADFPFLGACSGNGLLGSYCGATISTKFAEPVGAVNINVTSEGKKDALLYRLPTTFKALVGHKEACDQVPENAVLLASSATCPVQMFRVKENIYATQFHPEADSNEFILRISAYKDYGYFNPTAEEQLIAEIQGLETPFSQEILARFVKRYLSR